MKIIFLARAKVEEHKGGTELNNRILVNIGLEKGHDVVEMDFNSYNRDEIKTADVVVISCGMRVFPVEEQHWILDNCKNVIRYDGDYGFCKFGNCKCFGDMTASAECGECTPSSELYMLHARYLKECKYYVFLSPGHVDMFKRFYDVPDDKVLLYVPFYKPDEDFQNQGLNRIKNSVLWAGRFSMSKGLSKTMTTMINNPEKKFFVCGQAATTEATTQIITQLNNINNCTYLGDIEHDTMPHIYNLMENFIFEGTWPDTGPGTILEAALCGCNLITNTKIATILSNNFKDLEDMRKQIIESKTRFWNKIEELKK